MQMVCEDNEKPSDAFALTCQKRTRGCLARASSGREVGRIGERSISPVARVGDARYLPHGTVANYEEAHIIGNFCRRSRPSNRDQRLVNKIDRLCPNVARRLLRPLWQHREMRPHHGERWPEADHFAKRSSPRRFPRAAFQPPNDIDDHLTRMSPFQTGSFLQFSKKCPSHVQYFETIIHDDGRD